MPDRSEWFFGYPEFSNPDEGDTLYGYSEGWDGEVAFTKFGEFGVELSEQGELISTFPEQGLMYIYEQEGDLLMAMVDVGKYLSSLNMNQIVDLPNGGLDILRLLEHMRSENLMMLMTITFGGINSFDVTVLNDKGEQQVAKSLEGVDFTKGVMGDLGIMEYSIAFEVTQYGGDGLLVAFGERGRDKRCKMVGLESSLFVDFEEALFGEDPARLQKLAKKIILN